MKQRKRYPLFLRLVSFLLIQTFLFQEVAHAAPDLKPLDLNFNLLKKDDLKEAKKDLSFIPASVAMIEDAWQSKRNEESAGDAGGESSSARSEGLHEHGRVPCLAGRQAQAAGPAGLLVYLIQDAHTNTSGQINLSKTLDLLLKKDSGSRILDRKALRHPPSAIQDPFYVFAEAAVGDNSLSFLRKADFQKRKEVADRYIRKGLLHGAEYLDITQDHDFTIWGVEDIQLYLKALESYKYVAKNRNKFQDYLKKIQQTIDTLKPRTYNPILLSFEDKQSKFLKEEIPLTDYFEILLEYSDKRQATRNTSQDASNLSLVPCPLSLRNYPHLKALKALKEKESQIDFKEANEEQQKAIASLSGKDKEELLETSDKEQATCKIKGLDHREQQGFYSLLEEKLAAQPSSPKSFVAMPAGRQGDHPDSRMIPAEKHAGMTVSSLYPNLFKYFSYLKASKTLNPKEILKELKTLEEEVTSSLTTTQDEETLLKCQRTLRLLNKLFNLTLTPEEYEEYEEYKTITYGYKRQETRDREKQPSSSNVLVEDHPDGLRQEISGATQNVDSRQKTLGMTDQPFTITHLTGFLNKKIMDQRKYYERALFLEEGYDKIVQASEEFYDLTLKRDQAFISNMLKKLKEDRGSRMVDRKDLPPSAIQNPQSCVLITGGFHTPNLKALLKQHNISYICLTPQVTQETNQKRYEEILLNSKVRPDLISSTLTASSATLADLYAQTEVVASRLALFQKELGLSLSSVQQPELQGARMAKNEVVRKIKKPPIRSQNDLLFFSTAQADFIFHMTIHGETSRIPDDILTKTDAWILETDDDGYPLEGETDGYWAYELLKDETQFREILEKNDSLRKTVFFTDVPAKISAKEEWFSEPWYRQPLGMAHYFVYALIVNLPFFRRFLPYYVSRRFFSTASLRSVLTAAKIDEFIVPRLHEQLGRKPVILIEYGRRHADMLLYLQNRNLRARVVEFHRSTGRFDRLRDEYFDKVIEIGIQDGGKRSYQLHLVKELTRLKSAARLVERSTRHSEAAGRRISNARSFVDNVPRDDERKASAARLTRVSDAAKAHVHSFEEKEPGLYRVVVHLKPIGIKHRQDRWLYFRVSRGNLESDAGLRELIDRTEGKLFRNGRSILNNWRNHGAKATQIDPDVQPVSATTAAGRNKEEPGTGSHTVESTGAWLAIELSSKPVLAEDIWSGKVEPVWGQNMNTRTLLRLLRVFQTEGEKQKRLGRPVWNILNRRLKALFSLSVVNAAIDSYEFPGLDLKRLRDIFIAEADPGVSTQKAFRKSNSISAAQEQQYRNYLTENQDSAPFQRQWKSFISFAARIEAEAGMLRFRYQDVYKGTDVSHTFDHLLESVCWTSGGVGHQLKKEMSDALDVVKKTGTFWRYYDQAKIQSAAVSYRALERSHPAYFEILTKQLLKLRGAYGDERASDVLEYTVSEIERLVAIQSGEVHQEKETVSPGLRAIVSSQIPVIFSGRGHEASSDASRLLEWLTDNGMTRFSIPDLVLDRRLQIRNAKKKDTKPFLWKHPGRVTSLKRLLNYLQIYGYIRMLNWSPDEKRGDGFHPKVGVYELSGKVPSVAAPDRLPSGGRLAVPAVNHRDAGQEILGLALNSRVAVGFLLVTVLVVLGYFFGPNPNSNKLINTSINLSIFMLFSMIADLLGQFVAGRDMETNKVIDWRQFLKAGVAGSIPEGLISALGFVLVNLWLPLEIHGAHFVFSVTGLWRASVLLTINFLTGFIYAHLTGKEGSHKRHIRSFLIMSTISFSAYYIISNFIPVAVQVGADGIRKAYMRSYRSMATNMNGHTTEHFGWRELLKLPFYPYVELFKLAKGGARLAENKVEDRKLRTKSGPQFYALISSIFLWNPKNTSNRDKTLSPKRPSTALLDGSLRQTASTFLSSNPSSLILGTLITGTYSIPLAVIISIRSLDLEGSQPIASAISVGMVVMLAPVSSTILMIFESLLPLKSASKTIMRDSSERGNRGMLKGDGVALGQFVLRIGNVGEAPAGNRFFVYFIPFEIMGQQLSSQRSRSGRVHARDFYQKPLVLKPFAYFLDRLGFLHDSHPQMDSNIPLVTSQGNGTSAVGTGSGQTTSNTRQEGARLAVQNAVSWDLSEKRKKELTIDFVDRAILDYRLSEMIQKFMGILHSRHADSEFGLLPGFIKYGLYSRIIPIEQSAAEKISLWILEIPLAIALFNPEITKAVTQNHENFKYYHSIGRDRFLPRVFEYMESRFRTFNPLVSFLTPASVHEYFEGYDELHFADGRLYAWHRDNTSSEMRPLSPEETGDVLSEIMAAVVYHYEPEAEGGTTLSDVNVNSGDFILGQTRARRKPDGSIDLRLITARNRKPGVDKPYLIWSLINLTTEESLVPPERMFPKESIYYGEAPVVISNPNIVFEGIFRGLTYLYRDQGFSDFSSKAYNEAVRWIEEFQSSEFGRPYEIDIERWQETHQKEHAAGNFAIIPFGTKPAEGQPKIEDLRAAIEQLKIRLAGTDNDAEGIKNLAYAQQRPKRLMAGSAARAAKIVAADGRVELGLGISIGLSVGSETKEKLYWVSGFEETGLAYLIREDLMGPEDAVFENQDIIESMGKLEAIPTGADKKSDEWIVDKQNGNYEFFKLVGKTSDSMNAVYRRLDEGDRVTVVRLSDAENNEFTIDGLLLENKPAIFRLNHLNLSALLFALSQISKNSMEKGELINLEGLEGLIPSKEEMIALSHTSFPNKLEYDETKGWILSGQEDFHWQPDTAETETQGITFWRTMGHAMGRLEGSLKSHHISLFGPGEPEKLTTNEILDIVENVVSGGTISFEDALQEIFYGEASPADPAARQGYPYVFAEINRRAKADQEIRHRLARSLKVDRNMLEHEYRLATLLKAMRMSFDPLRDKIQPNDDATAAIRRAIRESGSGSIDFELFYEIANRYFYDHRVQIGAHFKTYAQDEKEFGVLMAKWLNETWRAMGRPKKLEIVEMGAGHGVMAFRILYTVKENQPDLFRSLKYVIIDRSEGLIETQRKILEDFSGQVEWVHGSALDFDHLVENGVFISNELPDVFPVHRLRHKPGSQEIEIAYVKEAESNPDGLLFEDHWIPLEQSPKNGVLREYMDRLHKLRGSAYVKRVMATSTGLPVNLCLGPWLENVSKNLKNGHLVTVDYGFGGHNQVVGDHFVRGYHYVHKLDGLPYRTLREIYQHPGSVDITHDPDFLMLVHLGRRTGLQTQRLVRQLDFFEELSGNPLHGLAGNFHVLLQKKGPTKKTAARLAADKHEIEYNRRKIYFYRSQFGGGLWIGVKRTSEAILNSESLAGNTKQTINYLNAAFHSYGGKEIPLEARPDPDLAHFGMIILRHENGRELSVNPHDIEKLTETILALLETANLGQESIAARLAEISDLFKQYGIDVNSKGGLDFNAVPDNAFWVMDEIRKVDTSRPIIQKPSDFPKVDLVYPINDLPGIGKASTHSHYLAIISDSSRDRYPAVVKIFKDPDDERSILTEIISAQVWDRLGTHAKFYGVVEEKGKIIGYAQQLVIEDRSAPNVPFTHPIIQDINERAVENGLEVVPINYGYTRKGNVVAFDAGDIVSLKQLRAFIDSLPQHQLRSEPVIIPRKPKPSLLPLHISYFDKFIGRVLKAKEHSEKLGARASSKAPQWKVDKEIADGALDSAVESAAARMAGIPIRHSQAEDRRISNFRSFVVPWVKKRGLLRMTGETSAASARQDVGARLALGLYLMPQLKNHLKQEQKQQLKQLILLRTTILAPIPDNAVVGLEGLTRADSMLREHNAIGIVIGSTAAGLWKRGATDEELKKHKDIDVIILKGAENFDFLGDPQGIDWWVPVKKTFDVSHSWGSEENVTRTLYVNLNNIFLRAGFDFYNDDQMEPGLYLPSRDLLIDLTEKVILALIDEEKIGPVDGDAFEVFHKRLDRELGKFVSPVWRENFGGLSRVFGEGDSVGNLSVNAMDLPTIRAIHENTPYRDVGSREFENRYSKMAGQNSVPIGARLVSDNVIPDWNRYIGEIWHQIFEDTSLPKNGAVVEVAPGSVPKIGHGLADHGFKGDLYVVEPDLVALREIVKAYRALLPDTSIFGIQKRLRVAIPSLPRSPDMVLANHALDDMILGHWLTDENFKLIFDHHYSISPQIIQDLWTQFEFYPAHMAAGKDMVLDDWKQLIRQAAPRWVALSQYASFFFQKNEISTPDTIAKEVLGRIKDFAVEQGLKVSYPTHPYIRNPKSWLLINRPNKDGARLADEKRILDVAIAGAGPAGVMLGRLLAERGFSFVIFEAGRAFETWRKFPSGDIAQNALISVYPKDFAGYENHPDLQGVHYERSGDVVKLGERYIRDSGIRDNILERTRMIKAMRTAEGYFEILSYMSDSLQLLVFFAKSVVLATGIFHSRQMYVIPGEDQYPDRVVNVYGDLPHKLKPEYFIGKRVVLAGGGNTNFGVLNTLVNMPEGQRPKNIVMISSRPQILWREGNGYEATTDDVHRPAVEKALSMKDESGEPFFKLIPSSFVTRIGADKIYYKNGAIEEQNVPYDRVVISSGFHPDVIFFGKQGVGSEGPKPFMDHKTLLAQDQQGSEIPGLYIMGVNRNGVGSEILGRGIADQAYQLANTFGQGARLAVTGDNLKKVFYRIPLPVRWQALVMLLSGGSFFGYDPLKDDFRKILEIVYYQNRLDGFLNKERLGILRDRNVAPFTVRQADLSRNTSGSSPLDPLKNPFRFLIKFHFMSLYLFKEWRKRKKLGPTANPKDFLDIRNMPVNEITALLPGSHEESYYFAPNPFALHGFHYVAAIEKPEIPQTDLDQNRMTDFIYFSWKTGLVGSYNAVGGGASMLAHLHFQYAENWSRAVFRSDHFDRQELGVAGNIKFFSVQNYPSRKLARPVRLLRLEQASSVEDIQSLASEAFLEFKALQSKGLPANLEVMPQPDGSIELVIFGLDKHNGMPAEVISGIYFSDISHPERGEVTRDKVVARIAQALSSKAEFLERDREDSEKKGGRLSETQTITRLAEQPGDDDQKVHQLLVSRPSVTASDLEWREHEESIHQSLAKLVQRTFVGGAGWLDRTGLFPITARRKIDEFLKQHSQKLTADDVALIEKKFDEEYRHRETKVGNFIISVLSIGIVATPILYAIFWLLGPNGQSMFSRILPGVLIGLLSSAYIFLIRDKRTPWLLSAPLSYTRPPDQLPGADGSPVQKLIGESSEITNRDESVGARLSSHYRDLLLDLNPGMQKPEHEWSWNETQDLRFPSVYQRLLDLAGKLKGRDLNVLMLGPGNDEMRRPFDPNKIISSPAQFIETALFLKAAGPGSIRYTVVDIDPKILAAVQEPSSYVSRVPFAGPNHYVNKNHPDIVSKFLSLLDAVSIAKPDHGLFAKYFSEDLYGGKEGALYELDARRLLENMSVYSLRAGFEQIKNYGENQLDIIIALQSLSYLFGGDMAKATVDQRLGYLASLLKALKPQGRLFVDVITLNQIFHPDITNQTMKSPKIDRLNRFMKNKAGLELSWNLLDEGTVEVVKISGGARLAKNSDLSGVHLADLNVFIQRNKYSDKDISDLEQLIQKLDKRGKNLGFSQERTDLEIRLAIKNASRYQDINKIKRFFENYFNGQQLLNDFKLPGNREEVYRKIKAASKHKISDGADAVVYASLEYPDIVFKFPSYWQENSAKNMHEGYSLALEPSLKDLVAELAILEDGGLPIIIQKRHESWHRQNKVIPTNFDLDAAFRLAEKLISLGYFYTDTYYAGQLGRSFDFPGEYVIIDDVGLSKITSPLTVKELKNDLYALLGEDTEYRFPKKYNELKKRIDEFVLGLETKGLIGDEASGKNTVGARLAEISNKGQGTSVTSLRGGRLSDRQSPPAGRAGNLLVTEEIATSAKDRWRTRDDQGARLSQFGLEISPLTVSQPKINPVNLSQMPSADISVFGGDNLSNHLRQRPRSFIILPNGTMVHETEATRNFFRAIAPFASEGSVISILFDTQNRPVFYKFNKVNGLVIPQEITLNELSSIENPRAFVIDTRDAKGTDLFWTHRNELVSELLSKKDTQIVLSAVTLAHKVYSKGLKARVSPTGLVFQSKNFLIDLQKHYGSAQNLAEVAFDFELLADNFATIIRDAGDGSIVTLENVSGIQSEEVRVYFEKRIVELQSGGIFKMAGQTISDQTLRTPVRLHAEGMTEPVFDGSLHLIVMHQLNMEARWAEAAKLSYKVAEAFENIEGLIDKNTRQVVNDPALASQAIVAAPALRNFFKGAAAEALAGYFLGLSLNEAYALRPRALTNEEISIVLMAAEILGHSA